MKRTAKYQLTYFEKGDTTLAVQEMQRWETIDAQLQSMFAILGNGVVSGWDLVVSSGLSLAVTEGKGHVAFVAVETVANTIIDGLTPSVRNYIYASLVDDSYWNQTVSFSAQLSLNSSPDIVLLGFVDTNTTTVTNIDITGRSTLGFLSLITSVIADHRHIGGTNNPPPINLASEVRGVLNQNSLPDLDASIIKSGIFDDDRLPAIDHISKLINQGTLTHSQLDSYVEALSTTNPTLMGETSTVNLLQLLLSLKHIYPGIDEFLINEIALIPGITPDSYIDFDNTTATVDVRTWAEGGDHKITGSVASGQTTYTKTWDSEIEFNASTNDDVIIDGSSVTLNPSESTLLIDQFDALTDWTVTTDDLSSVAASLTLDTSTVVQGTNSAKVTVGDQEVEIALLFQKDFDAMDWSGYDYLVFYINTTSVEHGDVIFYLNDSTSGTQDSYIKVLDRNRATVNRDTLLNGWQEVTVNIKEFTRTNINRIGFLVSTQSGWDTSKGFDFNVDKIQVTSGNQFESDGYIRLTYGTGTPYLFWRVRWDASIPTDSESTGLVLKSRTRVGNSLEDLSTSIWSVYTSVSGTAISLPDDALYEYIEVEMFFEASTTLTRSATVNKVYLDFYSNDVESSFNYDDDDDWNAGSLFNIDTVTNIDSMIIAGSDEINDIFYGTEGKAIQLDDDLNQLYEITGSILPRSTPQAINGLSPSLGLIAGVSRGNQGNIWMADVDNDRVVEVDKSGYPVRAFYGSHLVDPGDPYGTEETGPGSNTDVNFTSLSISVDSEDTIDVLHTIYNSDEGSLYIVFSENLEPVHVSTTTLNLDKIYLKIGTQRFYMDDSTVELLGIDGDKYDDWIALVTSTDASAEFVNQFSFNSHVLKITMVGADKVALNALVNQAAASIVIIDPKEQERETSSVTVNVLTYNFDLGNEAGEALIRFTLDDVTVNDVFAKTISYTGLANGVHTLKAQLVKANGNIHTNIEAIAEGTFVVESSVFSSPYISIDTPSPNQIYSSSPVVFDFTVENFAITSTDQHLQYRVDSDAFTDWYSTDSITVSDIDAGEHTFTIRMVDINGDAFVTTYGSATVNFIVGVNSNARVKLFVDDNAIKDSTLVISTGTSITDVDVANVYFRNIYAPFDVQVIPVETSIANPTGLPSVVVAKLRSPSFIEGLGTSDNVSEFEQRLIDEVTTTTTTIAGTVTTTTTTSAFSGIETSSLIFESNYLDGHSVVQLDMTGNVLMSNNAAKFASTRSGVRNTLGSAWKIGDSELLMADSVNKRAIVTHTDLDTKSPKIEWEYVSDRFISDFHIVLQDNVVVSVGDAAIDQSDLYVRQGMTVIWSNDSSAPISIYSGTTTFSGFQGDPDLTIYGDTFSSVVLQPGERFQYRFVSAGEFDWFVYPTILTGKVNVTRNRISSRDQFIILENDGLDSPFSSRVMRVDSWGNVLWSFGEGYLVNPRDARPLLNDDVLIST